MSWNIQFGVEVDAAARMLLEHPELADADLVLVQEMDEDGTARLADALDANHVYAAPGAHVQTGRNFGNAILTRWPLDGFDVVTLPHVAGVSGQERVLVRGRVTVGERSIDVGSTHTEIPLLGGARRKEQFDVVADAFADGSACVVGGDFNTLTRRGIDAIAARMASVGATRVTAGAGPTLRRRGIEFTLDHVFTRGFEPIATGVAHDAGASDHRPIWVQLRPAGPA